MAARLGRLFTLAKGGAAIGVRPSVLAAHHPHGLLTSSLPLGAVPLGSLAAPLMVLTQRTMATAAKKAPAKKKKTTTTKKTPAKRATAGRKKTAAKKTTGRKKTAAKKTAGRKKTKAKAKRKAAKPKKKAVRKPVTAETKLKLKAKECREVMLRDAPKKPSRSGGAFSAWIAQIKSGEGKGFTPISKDDRAAFEAVPDAEKAKLDELSKARFEKRQADYTKWIESHTPAEIQAANAARRWLNAHWRKDPLPLIEDHRLPKRPSSPLIFYCREHFPTHTGKPNERLTTMAKEWNDLAPSQKAKYEALSQADRQRYVDQKGVVFA